MMKHNKKKVCISILLVIVLLLPILNGCTPKSKEKAVSGTLNKETVKVGSDRLSLNMGDYPLVEDAECTIKPVKAPEFEGVNVQAYDFTIDTEEELLSIMELTIPYDESELNGKSPEGNIGAAYYNEEAKEWEPVSFTINEEAGTVTIDADHLSIYGCFAIEKENTRAAYVSYVIPSNAMLTLYNSDADAIITSTAKNEGNPAGDAIDAGLNILGLSLGIGSAGVETLSHTMEALGGVTGAVGGTSLINNVGDKLGILGNACAVAQISRGMYNIYHGDSDAIFPCYKNAFNTGLSYTAGKVGGQLVSLAFLGVTAIDYSLTKFGETAWSGRKDIYSKAYSLYYDKNKRSPRQWAEIFLKARETAADSDRYKIRIEGLIQRYAEEFWQDESVVAEYQSEVQKQGFTGGGGLNQKMKDEISSEYRKELLNGELQEAFKLLAQRDAVNAENELRKELNKARRELNQVCSLELYDGSLSDKEAVSDAANMKAYVAVPEHIEDPESWGTAIDEKGNGKIQFRLLGYLMAGMPTELNLYEEDAARDGEASQTISFTMEKAVQKVDIGVKGLSLEEILGNYEGETNIHSLSISDEGYQAYLDDIAETDGEEPISKAECDQALTQVKDEEGLKVSSIEIISEDPKSKLCTIKVEVLNPNEGDIIPISVGAEYNNGVLVVQGNDGESILTPSKEADGSIHLVGEKVSLGALDESARYIGFYFNISFDLVKVN